MYYNSASLKLNTGVDRENALSYYNSLQDVEASYTINQDDINSIIEMVTVMMNILSIFIILLCGFIIITVLKTIINDNLFAIGIYRNLGLTYRRIIIYFSFIIGLLFTISYFIGLFISIIVLNYMQNNILQGEISVEYTSILKYVCVYGILLTACLMCTVFSLLKYRKYSIKDFLTKKVVVKLERNSGLRVIVPFIILIACILAVPYSSLEVDVLYILLSIIGIMYIIPTLILLFSKIFSKINHFSTLVSFMFKQKNNINIINLYVTVIALSISIIGINKNVIDQTISSYNMYTSDIVVSGYELDYELIEKLESIEEVESVYGLK